ncbi:uncharacterized protein ACA1_288520 [Acanthamoeba castellanii str. Neff]|uniref:Uncharacterized protein n=1 Tax=Acanthamoeba castellanii (strain ATCC 30010 / Neff) TaxID=1257118 RepID=L8HL93_ACACF|nr:uncharacterized protein ACA1_288520 [Acanthamoeba castellanii str. Neff]ELR25131.1 hypothetical protein ACA1_288520 [Acanthamoeba castellanii str. Neff]
MEAKDETKTLWEELPHKALDNGPGAFQLADGRIAYLAFAKKDGFPSVDQRAGLTVAPNAGSVEDFVQRHEQEPTLVRQVRNKVRKCAGCGKPNAFTLPHCNGCGLDLSTTAISFTNNVFVGFVYGIEKGPFPLTVSLRYEDEESLVFDDLLALSPCHLNSVPTTAYIPDWRYLLKDPVQGLALIDRLFGRCWQAVEEQFYADEAWHAKILKSGVTLAQLKDHVVAGFNYPPSQYHLHIQFIVPPFLPFQWALYLQAQRAARRTRHHAHRRRRVPLQGQGCGLRRGFPSVLRSLWSQPRGPGPVAATGLWRRGRARRWSGARLSLHLRRRRPRGRHRSRRQGHAGGR